ncbi:MAG TPA: hypothetical protein DEE98_04115 [Elusimicrobia bacterium]|nr:MAG: hypothetical protein A2278_07125 [Elusimicrobia bacterium RIFOXYA12_FULL_49_49]OGS05992.1 MAG: hypothetical protein A2204_02930 [Elusimicrobia bacterium RIFOXYA1_FULL_47_7]OGS10536.1 MAG: hypothetical protein A2386_05515 [Elusimicrobia bacterium RIFOXYB1_FULL_48_9]OGS16191.1 MAG: hypothetical protein A2251_01060 [Elusimicrobia bacterium RIFOXYA2_FULL_47_53]OGS26610.1 MAG: hypothetical protein A2339_04300 [Elusimicrobia bacterium RIFOXYB12_FULL_50_12]OGS31345.1 MAG: hypothetical protein
MILKLLACSLTCLALFSGRLISEETERFYIPETQPVIERLPPGQPGQPILRKQNFISDSSVELSYAWPEPVFTSFSKRGTPFSLGVYQGSFGLLGADLRLALRDNWNVIYSAGHSDGENRRLAGDLEKFSFQGGFRPTDELFVSVLADSKDSVFFDRRGNSYSAVPEVKYYPADNFNIKGRALLERHEVNNAAANELTGGEIRAAWQPFRDSELSFNGSLSGETGYKIFGEYSKYSLSYSAITFGAMDFSLEADYDNKKMFYGGSAGYEITDGLRARLSFIPGFDKPEWGALYESFDYTLANPFLLWPENTEHYNGSISYYVSEKCSAEASYSLKKVKNMIAWEKDALSDFLYPFNIPQRDAAGGAFKAEYNAGLVKPSLEAVFNFADEVPMLPGYTAKAGIEFALEGFEARVDYRQVSKRRFTRITDDYIGEFGSAGLSIKRILSGGVELSARADNILGQKIEVQPGFTRTMPEVSFGVVLNFK